MTNPAAAPCRIVQYPYSTSLKPPRRLYVPADDKVICHSISGMGYWDFRIITNLYHAVARGGSFVEVGGNIGSDTVLAAEFFSVCHVFEPAAKTFDLLCQNLDLNQISNARLYPQAVSDQAGLANLYFPESNNLGAANLQPSSNQTSAEQVQVVTLDAALPGVNDCTFVHIDTEGHDIKVLKGARQFIARQAARPMIRLEFQPRSLAQHGSTADELIEFNRQFGYNVIFNASGNYCPLSDTVLREIYQLWQASNGWIDLLLWPP